jgi:hypothetical protein
MTTPSDYDYYKLAIFAASAAMLAIEHAMVAAQEAGPRHRASVDGVYYAGAAAEAAIDGAKETLRFCLKYAPHARRGQGLRGDFDAVAGIREAAAQLKQAEAVYEASIP